MEQASLSPPEMAYAVGGQLHVVRKLPWPLGSLNAKEQGPLMTVSGIKHFENSSFKPVKDLAHEQPEKPQTNHSEMELFSSCHFGIPDLQKP